MDTKYGVGTLEKSDEQLKSEALGLLMEHNTRVMDLCEIGFDYEDKIKPLKISDSEKCEILDQQLTQIWKDTISITEQVMNHLDSMSNK